MRNDFAAKYTKRRCYVPRCRESRLALARMCRDKCPEPRRVPTHICPPCGRSVCDEHSIAGGTHGYGKHKPRLTYTLHPPICMECSRRMVLTPDKVRDAH